MDSTDARNKVPFAPATFAVMRTPLLPFDDFAALGVGLKASKTIDEMDPEQFETRLRSDRVLVRSRLATLCEQIEIREAIFLASPNLDENIPRDSMLPLKRAATSLFAASTRC